MVKEALLGLGVGGRGVGHVPIDIATAVTACL